MIRALQNIFENMSSMHINADNALDTVKPRNGEWTQAEKQNLHWWLSALRDGTCSAYNKPYSRNTMLGFKTCADVMDSVIMVRKAGTNRPEIMDGLPWEWGTMVDKGVAQRGRYSHALFRNEEMDGRLVRVNLTDAGRKVLSALDNESGPIDISAQAEKTATERGYRRWSTEQVQSFRAHMDGQERYFENGPQKYFQA